MIVGFIQINVINTNTTSQSSYKLKKTCERLLLINIHVQLKKIQEWF